MSKLTTLARTITVAALIVAGALGLAAVAGAAPTHRILGASGVTAGLAHLDGDWAEDGGHPTSVLVNGAWMEDGGHPAGDL